MLNEHIHGFTVTDAKDLPELQGVLYRMTHDRTGLELVWLKRNEENKTFGIAFETLPWDDTGVFHILEHSVLCGSDKYPVKEPFVELMKSSMNTFLNAMTFPDKTFYPISSRNGQDFVNLMRVYLDAVFCPLIYSKPEIFRQEGWHYELDEAGAVSYKGVVFNEMKGAFASADELVYDGLSRVLFPDSPYRFVSGGDPAAIPDLTYEAFVDSHRRFYAPSNAYVYLDGDVDIENTLAILNDEYLCRYEKTERMAPPPVQTAVTGETEGSYELAPGEDPAGKTRLAYGKVIGTFADREKLIAMQVLSEVLCGSNQSPLCKAVLTEGLAEEVKMAIHDGILQPWLMLDVKNAKEDALPQIETLITSTLETLADKGLDHAQLEAVMANTEFKLRERDYGYYPQGLIFGFNVLESWLYGGDPAANLEVGDLFVTLKEKMAHGYFEDLIRDVLLHNPHSGKITLRPSHTAGEERRAAEQARIDRETALWSDADRAAVAQQQATLTEWQESQDTPEMLATIPQLSLSDIPTQPEQIPTQVGECDGLTVITHPLATGGITYVNLYFNADSCSEEDLSCLSFTCSLLGKTDTATHSAEEILNKTRLLCGNFHATPVVYCVNGDSDRTVAKLCVSFSTLDHNLPQALELVTKILTSSVFADTTAHDLLRQRKMQMFQNMVMSGHAMGLGRIAAQTSPSGVADECMGGVAYYQWLKAREDNWDFEGLNAEMTALLNRLINCTGLTVSVTGGAENAPDKLAGTLAATIPAKPLAEPVSLRPWGIRREGIVIPADISFAVMGGSVNHHGGSFSGRAQLAAQIVSLGYLWNAIRVQGGAYGAGMISRDTGLTACYSYRDPNGPGSVDTYLGCASFLREFAGTGADLTGFIIGTVANNSPLMTPRTKAQAGDKLYFTQTTWEQRCLRRKELLEATAEDMLSWADVLDATLQNGGICIVGGQEQLDKCARLEEIISL